MASWDWVNNGSCDVLLLNSTWPLSGPCCWQRNKLSVRTYFDRFCSKKNRHQRKCHLNVSKISGICSGLNVSVPCLWSPLCWVQAICISSMCISGATFDYQWPPVLDIGHWTWNLLALIRPVHCGARGDTQCGPELWNRHIYVNHHDQKYLFIFIFLLFE